MGVVMVAKTELDRLEMFRIWTGRLCDCKMAVLTGMGLQLTVFVG